MKSIAKYIYAGCIFIVSCTSQSLETTFNTQETKIADYAETVRFIECGFLQDTDDQGNPLYNNDGSPAISRVALDTIAPVITHNGGATRLTVVPGEGAPLSETGSATLYFAGYVFQSGPAWTDFTYTSLDGSDETWLMSTPYTGFTVSSSESGLVIGGQGNASGISLFATNHYATAMMSGWTLSEGDYAPLTADLGSGDLIDGLQAGLVGVRAGEVCDILFSGKLGLGKKPLGTVPANSALLYRIWVVSVSE